MVDQDVFDFRFASQWLRSPLPDTVAIGKNVAVCYRTKPTGRWRHGLPVWPNVDDAQEKENLPRTRKDRAQQLP
ncbi:hypothetical protein SAMN05192539_105729 [Paraburkholderia diazotrophica]|uniref:Uncharacterized protein n=1 Tax=Paraburkholderia diazotrophica TaxID=667676 RepID=A0A1H7EEK8_9BURK|nr:hypothetical protein SAMN05192539_105729 [Paraburkholderia diazotrophica]